jgi:hypothetical protein
VKKKKQKQGAMAIETLGEHHAHCRRFLFCQAAHWMALGCVSFVREAEMRGESKSKVERSAHSFTRRPTHSTTTPGRFLAQDVK